MAEDRLTGLDASFLHLEDDSAHMHVAGVMLFEGDAPSHEELIEAIESRLHLVPRYRQKLAFVPFGQGRPRWVDDPHLNLAYHVRKTALPPPGTEDQLMAVASRVFSQRLDRDKPLWEMWVAEGIDGGRRFAVLSKTHHALVDGISGVDIATVLFDTQPEPQAPPDPGERWLPRPLPSRAQLLAEALIERATVPREIVRGVSSLVAAPRRVLASVVESAASVGALARAGIGAPPCPYNRPIGPHRRFTWVRMSLVDVKAIKDALGGTVNDVMLATVAGALGRHLRRRGVETRGLELRAMVPVSVRAEEARGALGNQVAAMMAPLAVGCDDPVERFEVVHERMEGLKSSGQAVGAQVLTNLSGFAPPTIMSQASRLAARQRMFNLVVTNVPGPQFPLYMLGREMDDIFPMVPLVANQALGVAIMSYNGRINFGLVADYDAVPDLDELAQDFEASLGELAGAAGVALTGRRDGGRAAARNGHKPGARVGTAVPAGTGDGAPDPDR